MGTGVDITKINYTDPRFALYNNLQSDAARFATFRQAQKQRELSAAKTDLDKAKIEKRYKDYLATEKQGIFANAAAAERWTGFAENADLYPNLEYRTAGDSDVRAEHAKLDGIILPINDGFWRSHTPPLGWGCRCELVQTDEPANKNQEKYKGFEETTAPKGFDFNPGIEQKIFSDSAGYYTSAGKTEAEKLTKQAEKLIVKVSRLHGSGAAGKVFKTGNIGSVKFSKTGVKEAINQPHYAYAAKNMLLENPKGLMKGLKFKPGADLKDNPMVQQYHYAEIKLMDKKSWVVVREMKDGEMRFYSIVDNIDKYKK